MFLLDCVFDRFSFRNEIPTASQILIFLKFNQKQQYSKNNQIPCPCVITLRLVDGHGTRCCVPRYLRCSYSVGNSISVNLIINYPVSAFIGELSEKVYSLSEKERKEIDSCTKSLRWSGDEKECNWKRRKVENSCKGDSRWEWLMIEMRRMICKRIYKFI